MASKCSFVDCRGRHFGFNMGNPLKSMLKAGLCSKIRGASTISPISSTLSCRTHMCSESFLGNQEFLDNIADLVYFLRQRFRIHMRSEYANDLDKEFINIYIARQTSFKYIGFSEFDATLETVVEFFVRLLHAINSGIQAHSFRPPEGKVARSESRRGQCKGKNSVSAKEIHLPLHAQF